MLLPGHMHVMYTCTCTGSKGCVYVCVCVQLPSNLSFYRQITSYRKSIDVIEYPDDERGSYRQQN